MLLWQAERSEQARVLEDDRYRAGARRMAALLAAERDDGLVVDELERVANSDAPSHSRKTTGTKP